MEELGANMWVGVEGISGCQVRKRDGGKGAVGLL